MLLDAALRHQVQRYIQISTDEVYGSLGPTGKFTETTPIAPNSPYSASKAGADLLVRSTMKPLNCPRLYYPLLKQLRPLPVSGKTDPAVYHQCAESTSSFPSMATGLMCATGFMCRTTARQLTACCSGGPRERSIISAATVKGPTARLPASFCRISARQRH